MLDKSVPYFNVIMKRDCSYPFHELTLPIGYNIYSFKKGDEKFRAEIETSVSEFSNEEDCLEYFIRNYSIYEKEVLKRVYFLQTDKNRKIGTITAWWNINRKIKVPSIHWTAIRPEYQGKGLGRPLINFGIKQCREIDRNNDIYIHTQTWSYRAIYIYMKEGFKILKKGSFGEYENDFDKALPVLQEKIRGFRKELYCQCAYSPDTE